MPEEHRKEAVDMSNTEETNTSKITELQEILRKQIEWYKEHSDDESYVYDELYERFNDLSRGDFVDIIKVLL